MNNLTTIVIALASILWIGVGIVAIYGFAILVTNYFIHDCPASLQGD